MKMPSLGFIALSMASFFLSGCGQSSDSGIFARPDTDVTSSPEYNFKSFAGTVWKTKVNVALVNEKRYNGKHDLNLLVPMHFDPTHPDYTPAHDIEIISVLPVGTRVRI